MPSLLTSRESQSAEGQHPEAGNGLRNEQHLLVLAIDGLRKTAEAALERAEAAEADARKHRAVAEAAERSKAAELQRLREAGRVAASLFEEGQREREPQHGVVPQSLEARIADSVVAEVRAAVRAVSEEAAVELRAAAEELRRLRTSVMGHSEDIEGPMLLHRSSPTGTGPTAAGTTNRRTRAYSCEGRGLGHCTSSPSLSSCSSNIGSGTCSARLQQELLPRTIVEVDDASCSPAGSNSHGGRGPDRFGQLSHEGVVLCHRDSEDGIPVNDMRDVRASPRQGEIVDDGLRSVNLFSGRRETKIPQRSSSVLSSPVLRVRACENGAKRCHSVSGGGTELSRSACGENATSATPATPGQVRARARLHGSDAWWLAGHGSQG